MYWWYTFKFRWLRNVHWSCSVFESLTIYCTRRYVFDKGVPKNPLNNLFHFYSPFLLSDDHDALLITGIQSFPSTWFTAFICCSPPITCAWFDNKKRFVDWGNPSNYWVFWRLGVELAKVFFSLLYFLIGQDKENVNTLELQSTSVRSLMLYSLYFLYSFFKF